MEEWHTGASQLVPIRGNLLVLTNEYERLTTLTRKLEKFGTVTRQVRVDDWTGEASELFRVKLQERFKQALVAAEAHARASEELRNYCTLLERLQGLSDTVIADVQREPSPIRRTAARDSLDRWHQQLAEARRELARQLRKAADELATLHRLLPELPSQREVGAAAHPTTTEPRVADKAVPTTAPEPVAAARHNPPNLFDVGNPDNTYRLLQVVDGVRDYWRTQAGRLVDRSG